MKKDSYSVKDIADMAGVSAATISRVINQNGRFSKETEERVRAIIKQTNYQPNQLARGLRTNRTHTIGVLVPDITNEFFARIILEMQKRFFQDDYITLIFNTNEDKAIESLQINALQSQQVSGLVYVSCNPQVRTKFQVPIVYIDRKPTLGQQELSDVILIESDNEQGGMLAAEELAKKGCKHLACISFKEEISTHSARVSGYRAVLKKYGLPDFNSMRIQVNSVNFEESKAKATDLFARYPDIDGIFCTTDTLAVGAIKAAHDVGLLVPEQLKVVGFDDTSIGAHAVPALTTIHQRVDDIGRLTAEFMIDMLNHNEIKKKHCKLPVELIVRGST